MTKAKETIASATEKCKDVENKMKVGLSAGVVRILKILEFLESLKFSFIHFGPWKSFEKTMTLRKWKSGMDSLWSKRLRSRMVYQYCHCIIVSCMHIVGDTNCAWRNIFVFYLEPTIGDKIVADVSFYRKQKLIARRNWKRQRKI